MPLFSRRFPSTNSTWALISKVVPAQQSGGQSSVQSTSRLPNLTKAEDVYRELKLLLLDVSNWHRYVPGITARFSLTDKTGNLARRQAALEDHFKIRIPGPALRLGEGYDWTSVEAKEELQIGEAELFFLKAVPSPNPRSDHGEVAHFLKASASTTFIILKEKRKVSVLIQSRNEIPNSDVPGWQDRARNRAVGFFAGIYLSRFQWSKLANSLMRAGLRGTGN